MSAGYETLIVTFSDPIKVLDNMFADADAWGTDSLKGWVEDYESTRFTQINGHTAVITSEYNMPCVKEWLTRCTAIPPTKRIFVWGGGGGGADPPPPHSIRNN
jgi:hypothetical protein